MYAGSAPYYARGRLPYPQELAEVLTKAILLQKLAETTEKLVQLSEHAKKLTELQHA